ncbi:zinc-dependent metalloprotease [Aliivibrio fischeri]|uniref:EcxA zinc-binding domain-containing protein n=1 Tax=Aliivibrio fischeri TaxID=668 RepID=A0A510UBV5_ALIFS|nr:zinc-dependent metalloprotease [Aliivibrio fischeri]GEK11989.1 hypothetical protein AFI02nite_00250 [Aliivibrio fischeri]
MTYKKLTLAAAVTVALTGCAPEEQEYDTLDKDLTEVKVQDLRVEGRWFYAPTTGAAPRFAVTQFPFLQGMGRYVELCFSDEGLEVRGYDNNNPDLLLPKDKNGFCLPQDESNIGSDDQVNFPHVMTIPGSYAKYQCREDNYGDCTNVEEKDSDPNLGNTTFRNNTHFTPSPESTLVSDLNWDELYGTKDGLTPQGSPEVISWEFDPKKGVLNFELEQTFKINFSKLSRYMDWSAMEEELAKGSFKSRFYYSLVHESHLASEDYTPIVYPDGDDDDFGFFTTTTLKLDPITNKYNDITYLNRFNPSKSSIDYYLSDNFFEDKNKIYLDATIETINKMNLTLNVLEPNSGKPYIQIVNKTEGMGIHAGDLRYNVINLVDEPLDNGLLGYGPSIANPRTGEIIKAHVNQYSGVARTGSSYYWNNLVRLYNNKQLANVDYFVPAEKPVVPNEAPDQEADVENQQVQQAMNNQVVRQLEANRVVNADPYGSQLAQYIEPIQDNYSLPPVQLNHLNPVHDHSSFEDVAKADMQRLQLWSENSVYPIEAMWISATQKTMLENLNLSDAYFTEVYDGDHLQAKVLKKWKQLSPEQQRKAADMLTITTYTNTLVHEIGHNLGLRHNFKGSNDSNNYLSPAQAEALGINGIPAYSSTMDYAPSMFDEIPTWGLYDVAAFKFAYGRKVDVIDFSPSPQVDKPEDLIEQAPEFIAPDDRELTEEEQAQLSAWEKTQAILAEYETWDSYLSDHNRQTAQYRNYQNFASSGVVSHLNTDNPYITCTEVKQLGNINNDGSDMSKYTCDLSKFDQLALQEHQADAVKYGVMHYFKQIEDQNGNSKFERVDFDFCTDGNVSLNSDCNRFDEGTNLEEIVLYKWQRYLDNYENTNAGILSDSGLTTSNYIRYIQSRFSFMNEIREVIEDTELQDNFFSKLGYTRPTDKPLDFFGFITESDCRIGKDNSDLWYCEYGNATKQAASFFLSVLKTPEHQCIIETKESTDPEAAVIESQLVSFGDYLSLKLRRHIPEDYDISSASCFDDVIQEAIATVNNDRDTGNFTQATLETKGGKFLNSVSSFSPDNNYSNSVSTLGIWPDKALSSYFLARRYTLRYTDEPSFAALMDWPGVKQEFDNIMEHLVAGTPFASPVEMINSKGESIIPEIPVSLHFTNKLEALPPMPCGITDFLNISCTARADIPSMLIAMAAKNIHSTDYEVRERSLNQFNSWVKETDNYYLPDENITFVLNNKKYAATQENTLAWKYAHQLDALSPNELTTTFATYTRAELQTVLNTWDKFLNMTPVYQTVISFKNHELIRSISSEVKPVVDQLHAWGFETLTNDALNYGIDVSLGSLIENGALTQLENGDFKEEATGKEYPINDIINVTVYLQFIYHRDPDNFELIQTVAKNYQEKIESAVEPREITLWEQDPLLIKAYLDNDFRVIDNNYQKVKETLNRLPTVVIRH